MNTPATPADRIASAGLLQTTCCIAGGGPAGMMLGLLLARAGIDVIVLEKHGDFLRDFRGDTVHPSTLELIYELGLLDTFLARPHQRVERLSGIVGDTPIRFADFTHLPTHCRFIVLMPQWDFLDFLRDEAERYPGFRLLLRTEATGLVTEGGRIAGVQASTPDGAVEIRADLVVAADGRRSRLRAAAGLAVDEIGAPMDVFWMRLSRRESDSEQTFGRIAAGAMFVMINRQEYWQCALVIPKGAAGAIRERGIAAFRTRLAEIEPMLADRTGELASFDDVKLLSVSVDRLREWSRPGLLCIGDAAHAMSPIGGVGINLAVQDAVAAANILAAPLKAGTVTPDDLRSVQRRRSFPTRATQRLQVAVQNGIISRVLAGTGKPKPPWPVRVISRFPILQRIPARLVGLGLRPEHICTPYFGAARQ